MIENNNISHELKTTESKCNSMIGALRRDRLFKTIKNLKEKSFVILPEIKNNLIKDKLTNKDVLYKRNYNLFAHNGSNMFFHYVEPKFMYNKYVLPNVKKEFVSPHLKKALFRDFSKEKSKRMDARKNRSQIIYNLEHIQINNLYAYKLRKKIELKNEELKKIDYYKFNELYRDATNDRRQFKKNVFLLKNMYNEDDTF